jgi:hypothetical protein
MCMRVRRQCRFEDVHAAGKSCMLLAACCLLLATCCFRPKEHEVEQGRAQARWRERMTHVALTVLG